MGCGRYSLLGSRAALVGGEGILPAYAFGICEYAREGRIRLSAWGLPHTCCGGPRFSRGTSSVDDDLEPHGHEGDLLEVRFDKLALFNEVGIGEPAWHLHGEGLVVECDGLTLFQHMYEARLALVAPAKLDDVIEEYARFVIHLPHSSSLHRGAVQPSCVGYCCCAHP